MWQHFLVGGVVMVAGGYAFWYWMPAAWRRPLGRLQKGLGEAPGCSACSDCTGCAAPAKTLAKLPQSPQSPQSLHSGDPGDPRERAPVWMRPGR